MVADFRRQQFKLTEYPDLTYISNIWTHPDIWQGQKQEVKNYCDNLINGGGIEITYIKYKKYGRFFVKDHKCRSSTIMWNKIRSSLFKDRDYDLDIINCHSNILLDILSANPTIYDTTCLKNYCYNRDEIINSFDIPMEYIDNYNKEQKCNYTKKDFIKSLFTIILYGGTIDTWKKEFGIDYLEIPEFVYNFITELKQNSAIIVSTLVEKRFTDIIKWNTQIIMEKEKKRLGKNFDIELFNVSPQKHLSIILQEYETLIVMKIFDNIKNICDITSYNYDGFQVKKESVMNLEDLINTINNTQLLLSHNGKDFVKFNNIKFINKDFKEGLDISLLANFDTDEFDSFAFNSYKTFEDKSAYFSKYFKKIKQPSGVAQVGKEFHFYKQKKEVELIYNWLTYWGLNKDGVEKEYNFLPKWYKTHNEFYATFDYYPNPKLCPKNVINAWSDFPIKDYSPDTNDNITAPIYFHIKTLVGEECGEYLLNWFAHIVQYPERKTEVCPVLFGKQRIGKSIICEKLLEKIIGRNKVKITADANKVFGRFSATSGALLVVLNEASGRDTFGLIEQLKDAITCQNSLKELKGQDCVDVYDFANYIFTTNNKNCVKIDDGDKRFAPMVCSDTLYGNYEHFTKIYNMMEDCNIMRTFYDELMERDLTDVNLCRDRPQTTIMEDMKELNKCYVADFIDYWREIVSDHDDNDCYNLNRTMAGEPLYNEYCKWYYSSGFKADHKDNTRLFGSKVKGYTKLVSWKRCNTSISYTLLEEGVE